jgi:excinuclease ABC subunit B
MQAAIDETNRRRKKQVDYNEKHGIIPTTITSKIINTLEISQFEEAGERTDIDIKNINTIIKDLEQAMRDCAQALDFEAAAKLRDEILALKEKYNLIKG